jgi:hypothetical protein
VDIDHFIKYNKYFAHLGSKPDTEKGENLKDESIIVGHVKSAGYFSNTSTDSCGYNSAIGNRLSKCGICVFSSASGSAVEEAMTLFAYIHPNSL